MEEKKKPHPIGILLLIPIVVFLIWIAYQVLAEGIMNIVDP